MQPLDMVDKSTSPFPIHFEPIFGDGRITRISGRVEPISQRRQHDGNPAREGVFRRYNSVLRRALKGVRQA